MKSMMAYIRRQQPARLHFAGACTLLLIIGLFGALVLPAWSQWDKHREVEFGLEMAWKRLIATRARIDAARKALAAMKPWDAAEVQLLTATFDKRVLLISDVASAIGVVIDSVEPKQPTANGPATVAVSGRGSYEQINLWMSELRQKAPDLQVQSLQLSPAANDACASRVMFTWSSPPASLRAVVADAKEGL